MSKCPKNESCMFNEVIALDSDLCFLTRVSPYRDIEVPEMLGVKILKGFQVEVLKRIF